MNFLIGVGYIICVLLFARALWAIFQPTTCFECKVIIPKGFIKRIGLTPFCTNCYNDIVASNLPEDSEDKKENKC